ncbi:predicted protein [Plenodomus lingam JN3]|uniref:Uncharacterized protein n=1 Tax=Leptosphaeria maculans (strain JN3 / isolate v23.1.3 / race Av1-4-5-6-7-8) TaxID=985895 RepID=E5A7B3_LEPMJ|nr:predicted protein [Plenodomus lingam JN3]CBX99508.1 predicted protein [Plenodomus lingam JN3]
MLPAIEAMFLQYDSQKLLARHSLVFCRPYARYLYLMPVSPRSLIPRFSGHFTYNSIIVLRY